MNNIRHLRPPGQAVFKDRFTEKVGQLLIPWPDSEKETYGLVGLPHSKPSISHSGASLAPSAIRNMLKGFSTFSAEADLDLTDRVLDFGDLYVDPTDIVGNHQRLYEGMSDIFATMAAENWLMLGGDHSISYASIKAFAEQHGTISVIQFDAHHDLRNTDDGGPTNGTPFRRLLEDGVIAGENLVQIGIRDFANARAYRDYALQHQVRYYTMADIGNHSIKAILDDELARLGEKVDAVYLSVDMDVLDQAFAPGCPATVPGGMDSHTLMEAVLFLAHYKKTLAMDVVEIDPTIDFRNMTSRVAAYTILQFMKGKKLGKGQL